MRNNNENNDENSYGQNNPFEKFVERIGGVLRGKEDSVGAYGEFYSNKDTLLRVYSFSKGHLTPEQIKDYYILQRFLSDKKYVRGNTYQTASGEQSYSIKVEDIIFDVPINITEDVFDEDSRQPIMIVELPMRSGDRIDLKSNTEDYKAIVDVYKKVIEIIDPTYDKFHLLKIKKIMKDKDGKYYIYNIDNLKKRLQSMTSILKKIKQQS